MSFEHKVLNWLRKETDRMNLSPKEVGLVSKGALFAQKELGWRPIETFEIYEGRGYLTIHKDDLYPVAAFCFGKDWYRLTEGPEDIIKPEIGDLTKLLRPPTHLKEIDCPDEREGQGSAAK